MTHTEVSSMSSGSVLRRYPNILVTGSTGLIGGEIVRRLRAEEGPGKVFALIRPKDGAGVEARLRERLRRSAPHEPPSLGPLEAIAGDITLPDWGLSAEDFRRV